jgi:hypothetical protein
MVPAATATKYKIQIIHKRKNSKVITTKEATAKRRRRILIVERCVKTAATNSEHISFKNHFENL